MIDPIREAIVREALSWVGTRFHHGARLKGVGVDCAQLLIAVYSALALVPPIEPGFYSPDWFLHSDAPSPLTAWIEKFCAPLKCPDVGDVVAFRYGRVTSHAAIVLEWGDAGRVVHAFRGAGVRVEECAPHTALMARYVGAWGHPCPA